MQKILELDLAASPRVRWAQYGCENPTVCRVWVSTDGGPWVVLGGLGPCFKSDDNESTEGESGFHFSLLWAANPVSTRPGSGKSSPGPWEQAGPHHGCRPFCFQLQFLAKSGRRLIGNG